MLQNLLIYRMLIANACAGALVVWAWAQGYVSAVYAGDASRLTLVITGLFVVGLVSSFIRASKVSGLLNRLKVGTKVEVNGPKMLEKTAHLTDITQWLVTLGLLGTVLGFFVALGGVNPDDLSSASGVQRAVATLMMGMHFAITTTILGGFLSLWLEINRRMILTATVSLIEDAKK